ncbi:MAG: malate synthase G [Pseudohongiellaceae bacterium]|nr:malate synthase G [Pseudohongiellaceae bacterium]
MPLAKNAIINSEFYRFVNEELLPINELDSATFWNELSTIISDLAPVNRQLLNTRDVMQKQIDQWHLEHQGKAFDAKAYEAFLRKIGYIVKQGSDFSISTSNIDKEIATLSGPQLVVPAKNARFALNAANARWGSLYDAMYGTDVIPQNSGLEITPQYNKARGDAVIVKAKEFLDAIFPLERGSHKDVVQYVVYYNHLLAFAADGTTSGLDKPCQFVALSGHRETPEAILLKNNGLHVEIQIDRSDDKDKAHVKDIIIESALSTIIDCEDSVAAVDAEDKLEVYRNWLGLMDGSLQASFTKDGETLTRCLNPDRKYTAMDGSDYILPGRALLLVRNVGHLMDSDLMQDIDGNLVPEGILDAVVTSLIGAIDLKRTRGIRNSREGSIYIVKPKMHGPDEVAFSCELFSRVEQLLGLEKNTIKIDIMDEERRTSLNLKECIRMAKERVFFINTGFLDRTGDEIHTSMHAGAFLAKGEIKDQAWIKAYENRNVETGLECGLKGRAQIGKGMWAMPDEMAAMMREKIAHPQAGASTAWVPSPTAATLHALHYHQVDVSAVQEKIRERASAKFSDLLQIPLMKTPITLTRKEITRELENNAQGILGYVVRWIDAGIGCSKVPDINNVGLMEDRATLRISSQHIANWLLHGVCTQAQVDEVLIRMARVVDEQNQDTPGYQAMTGNTKTSQAYLAARDLIFNGVTEPNGYTEPLLHKHRILAKRKAKA